MRATGRASSAFTLIELLLVMVVILILVGIVIALAGPAQKRAARARATAEIEALRNGLERYRVDNAVYPSSETTNALDPRASSAPENYKTASRALYAMLTGQPPEQTPNFPPPAPTQGTKIYFEFKPGMLGDKTPSGAFPNGVSAINDPWGYSYGYSTAYQSDLDTTPSSVPSRGYSPGYDLWSVAGKSGSPQAQWIKTW
jgi:prepilin-type N-terminal cleavage/methylation domain-containing protein